MWKLGKDSWKKYILKDVCCYAEGKVGNILSWQRFMIAFSSVLLMLGLWFPWNVLALDVYQAFPQIFFQVLKFDLFHKCSAIGYSWNLSIKINSVY